MVTTNPYIDTTIFIGTYTNPEGSKGIYRLRLNSETGALSQPELAAEATAPSYLTFGADGRFVYAVNEYSNGEVTAYFAIAEGLKKLNTVQFDGRGPCHASVDPSGKWLMVSAYGGGTLTVIGINPDGSLGAVADSFKNQGTGPNIGRQEASHMHFATTENSGKNVYACDLGTDEVLTFGLDRSSGKLKSSMPRAGKTNPGTGPRHLVVTPNRKFVYVNNELTLGVSVFSRDAATGGLTLVQTISALPEGESTNGKSMAAIRMHPKLPYLYASIRGMDAIAVFDILPDGQLKLKKVEPAGVKEPRDFAIDFSGKWVVVAGQSSGDVVSFGIDEKTGLIVPTSSRVMVSKPVCVLFAPFIDVEN